ncbi:MAG: hypothetical protein R3B95_19660 [Nitrospirales bacterium]|nr:hypothetical protein [Nitrospirales bacterium]
MSASESDLYSDVYFVPAYHNLETGIPLCLESITRGTYEDALEEITRLQPSQIYPMFVAKITVERVDRDMDDAGLEREDD